MLASCERSLRLFLWNKKAENTLVDIVDVSQKDFEQAWCILSIALLQEGG